MCYTHAYSVYCGSGGCLLKWSGMFDPRLSSLQDKYNEFWLSPDVFIRKSVSVWVNKACVKNHIVEKSYANTTWYFKMVTGYLKFKIMWFDEKLKSNISPCFDSRRCTWALWRPCGANWLPEDWPSPANTHISKGTCTPPEGAIWALFQYHPESCNNQNAFLKMHLFKQTYKDKKTCESQR